MQFSSNPKSLGFKAGLTLLLSILQKLWAKCFHNWINTMSKYKMDYVWHKYTRGEMHKIPNHTCSAHCKLMDETWCQTHNITLSLQKEFWFWIWIMLQYSSLSKGWAFSQSCECHQGAMFPFSFPVWISAFISQEAFWRIFILKKHLFSANQNLLKCSPITDQLPVWFQPISSLICTNNKGCKQYFISIFSLQKYRRLKKRPCQPCAAARPHLELTLSH